MKTLDRVSVVGLGYVGLCTAATFASKGFIVVGVEADEEKARAIVNGKPPFQEPGLERILRRGLRTRRLKVDTNMSSVPETDITFLRVGTPSLQDGSIDLTYVTNATRQLGRVLQGKSGYHLVVLKSTVVPGTSSKVRIHLEGEIGRPVGPKLGLCTNPEFLREGSAIQDTLHPDKIVIGSFDESGTERLKKLYLSFHSNKPPPILKVSPETAEMIKYASNAFLANKISFINTIANICQGSPGADVEQVAQAIGLDPRIGSLFLRTGPGYGGGCFHKDLQALISYSKGTGYNPVLLRATEQVNEEQASRVVELCEKLLGSVQARRIAVLGLAFKKNTDDIREAASIRVIGILRRKGANVVAYDPMAIPNAKKVLPDIEYGSDPESTIRGADCCVLITEWDAFGRLKPQDYLAHMNRPNLVDARRLYEPKKYETLNFLAVGRGSVHCA